MNEPTWRQVLNWGCLVYFLGLPTLAIFLGFTDYKFDPPGVPAFLREFHMAVSVIIGALAGLNSLDKSTEVREKRIKNNESHDKHQPQPST